MKRWIGQAVVAGGICYVHAHTTKDGGVEISMSANGSWNMYGPIDTWPLMRLDRVGVEGLMALLDVTHAEGAEGLVALLRNVLAAMDGNEPQEYEVWDLFL